MTTNNMFEQASRKAIRFDSPKGKLTVEDLWTLPLTSGGNAANLDDIAKALHRQLKASTEEVSFVTPVVSKQAGVQLAFDIVKHIIDTRIAERDTAAEAADRSEKKQKILALIARKKDGALEEASVEELEAMARSL